MNRFRKWVALLAAVVGLGVASNASAVLINLSLTDTYYLGSIVNGIPSSEANELNWLNELIGLGAGTTAPSTNPAGETLTRSANTFGGATLFDAIGGVKQEDNGDRTITATSAYVLGKFGSGGDIQETHVWYVGGLTEGDVVNLTNARGGLSHTTLFSDTDRVPDGGSTLILIGLALTGLRFMKGRKKL